MPGLGFSVDEPGDDGCPAPRAGSFGSTPFRKSAELHVGWVFGCRDCEITAEIVPGIKAREPHLGDAPVEMRRTLAGSGARKQGAARAATMCPEPMRQCRRHAQIHGPLEFTARFFPGTESGGTEQRRLPRRTADPRATDGRQPPLSAGIRSAAAGDRHTNTGMVVSGKWRTRLACKDGKRAQAGTRSASPATRRRGATGAPSGARHGQGGCPPSRHHAHDRARENRGGHGQRKAGRRILHAPRSTFL